MTGAWHVEPELLALYATGRLDCAAQMSVEAHVTTCGQCRARAGELAPTAMLARAWDVVSLAVAAPRTPTPLRVLQRLGLPETDAVALHASASLQVPLVLGILGALGFAGLGTALAGGDQSFYLLVAPMVPALAVVAAYDTTDPLREVAGTTPYSKLRLALLRTLAAVLLSLPITVLIGLAVPGVGAVVVGWLLPSLATTSLALALLTWWRARAVGPGISGAWFSVVLLLRSQDSVSTVLLPAAQLIFACITVACAVLFVTRLSTFRVTGGST